MSPTDDVRGAADLRRRRGRGTDRRDRHRDRATVDPTVGGQRQPRYAASAGQLARTAGHVAVHRVDRQLMHVTVDEVAEREMHAVQVGGEVAPRCHRAAARRRETSMSS